MLCFIESMYTLVTFVMQLLQTSRWLRRRRAVGFDRAEGTFNSNCPSSSKSYRSLQKFHVKGWWGSGCPQSRWDRVYVIKTFDGKMADKFHKPAKGHSKECSGTCSAAPVVKKWRSSPIVPRESLSSVASARQSAYSVNDAPGATRNRMLSVRRKPTLADEPA